jgi:hypothetical protein
LRLGRKCDFVLLESVEDVALRDRIDSQVIDLPHSRLLFNVNMQDPAFGCGLALEANVFEIAGIPQRIEVSLYCSLVVDIPRTREDVCADGFCGNATVSVDLNSAHDIRLLLRKQHGRQRTKEDS